MPIDGLSPETLVQRVESVFSSSVGDELVIFDHERGTYYGSGPVGEAVWSALAEPRSIASLTDHLMEQFEIDRATCEADVRAFVQELIGNGLVRVIAT